jgi:hypothetical protein
LFIIALILLLPHPLRAGPVPVPPTTQPKPASPSNVGDPPNAFFIYEVELIPDKEAENLGVGPRRDSLVLQNDRVLSSKYVGGGCLPGAFTAKEARAHRNGSSISFHLSASSERDGATAEWRGTIVGETIHGEFTVSRPGDPLDVDSIRAEKQRLWDQEARGLTYVNGEPTNLGVIKARHNERWSRIEEERFGRGRTLRYAFVGRLRTSGIESGPRPGTLGEILAPKR